MGRKLPRAGIVTSEVDYTADEFELLKAVDAWKKRTGRAFPTNTEVLGIVRSLGYRKVPPAEGGA